METHLTFLKGDEVFEYRRRQPPGGKRINRNPACVVEFKRDLERVPSHSKFARPDGAISLNGFGEDLRRRAVSVQASRMSATRCSHFGR